MLIGMRLNAKFKRESNVLFNNKVFSVPTMAAMHESMERLYRAAKELKGITGQSAVAAFLNFSPQRVKNWEERGVSNQGAVTAEERIGCSSAWVKHGRGSMVAGAPPYLRGELPSVHRIEEALASYSLETNANAQVTLVPVVAFQGVDMSRGNNDDALKRGIRLWLTVPGELSNQAKVTTMPDDSMHPEIHPGEYIAFDPLVQADTGDTVLIADQYGGMWIRKFRPLPGGRFDAIALNADHAPLRSSEDGLRVLAVMVGHWRGRRAKRH